MSQSSFHIRTRDAYIRIFIILKLKVISS